MGEKSVDMGEGYLTHQSVFVLAAAVRAKKNIVRIL